MLGAYRKILLDDTLDESNGALPFVLQRVAEEELGETPSRRKDALQKLARLVPDEPELNSRRDDDFLLRFLRVRKYNVDAAMQTIRRYYRVRLACGPVYRDFLPTKVSPAARTLLMVMPEKDVHGRPVLLLKIGEWIPSELPFPELHKAWAICADHIAADPVTQVLGVVLLFDYRGFTIDKLFGISIGLLKKALEYVQDCMPMRMKGMHIINQSYAFDVLYMLVKPVIKSKLSERHIAEEELGETPSRRKHALRKLLRMVSEEPELNARIDSDFLLRFLRVRKYNVDAAMQTIRNYYKIRTTCGPVFLDFLPTKVSSEARALFTVMPEKDARGRRILFINVGEWTPDIPFSEFQKALTICLEHLASDPVTQTLGVVLLVDYNGFTVNKMLCVSVGLLKKALEYLQDCMPMRLKAAHILNQSYTFDFLYMIVKPIIKGKLSERFLLYGENYEKLHGEIPPSALPEKYGGTAAPFDCEAFWRQLDAEEELFAADNQYGYARTTVEYEFPTETEMLQELTFL